MNADETLYLGNACYNLFSYCLDEPVANTDEYGNAFKILAVGVQFGIQVGNDVVGVELLINVTNCKAALFMYVGSSSRNINVKSILNMNLSVKDKLINYIKSLGKTYKSFLQKPSIDASVSSLIVMGSKTSFPKDYCGWFTGLSATIKNVVVAAAYSKSGKQVIGSISTGASTQTIGLGLNQTYYIQIYGEDCLNNNFKDLKNSLLKKLQIFKFFSFLLG